MSFQFLGKTWSVWVLLIAGLIVFGLAFLVVLGIWLFRTPGTPGPIPTAVITMISAPTSTPRPPPDFLPETTPTAGSLVVNGIGVGMYVQITGTEGDGLRLRAGPGTGAQPRFLGREAEVFKVADGPRDSDGYTWWYLVAPYDQNRSGWAAANFLAVVAEPTAQPTP